MTEKIEQNGAALRDGQPNAQRSDQRNGQDAGQDGQSGALICPDISVMTEKTGNERYIIDPVAFFAALILAPILFTAATFWLLFIPLGALVFGGLPYLVVAPPVLLIHLRRHRVDPSRIAALAAVTSIVLVTLGTVMALLMPGIGPDDVLISALLVMAFAVIFAACWGVTFAWLYRSMARDFFTTAETF
jgi:hypothetical protein